MHTFIPELEDFIQSGAVLNHKSQMTWCLMHFQSVRCRKQRRCEEGLAEMTLAWSVTGTFTKVIEILNSWADFVCFRDGSAWGAANDIGIILDADIAQRLL